MGHRGYFGITENTETTIYLEFRVEGLGLFLTDDVTRWLRGFFTKGRGFLLYQMCEMATSRKVKLIFFCTGIGVKIPRQIRTGASRALRYLTRELTCSLVYLIPQSR